jgi:heterodisulfide reductase subunit A-like polyferredoxin
MKSGKWRSSTGWTDSPSGSRQAALTAMEKITTSSNAGVKDGEATVDAWVCSHCTCPADETSSKMRGPKGDSSLCTSCGEPLPLFFIS